MDSQESPHHHRLQSLLPHQHHHQPPSHGHGTMAPPPAPPPQTHHQEQPISFILPDSNIFQQPQQQNLQFPFNSVSGQNPKLNLDHSDGSPAAGFSSEPAKKKRGRPRKYPTAADGNTGLGLSSAPVAQIPPVVNRADTSDGGAATENPSKKGRGRPPGSGKKQQGEALGAVGFGFAPHLINVNIGEDIASKVMTFSQQGPRAVCILSATGVVCNVTLRQSAIGGGTVTYEGRFGIISLSGSFLLSESNGSRSRTGGLSVSLAGPDGRVFGGVVAGTLTAATPVQVVVSSFITEKEKPKSEATSLTPPPNMLNFGAGAPVTEASSPSPGASSDSADENGGSPLSHERGPFGNAAQPMHGMPTYWGQTM